MKKIISLFLLLFCFSLAQAASIKEPNVAGGFYSDNPKELSSQIDSFLAQAQVVPSQENIQAMIVPHAGYVYSGPVAAYGYKAVSKIKYTTIVILAPSHYFPFDGASLWREGGFKTPLGVLNVDRDFANRLLKADDQLKFFPEVYEKEHSLEVQLPFIQRTFGDVKIVPILMGNPDAQVCKRLAVALNEIIGSRQDVLVIASSDMSHYFPYEAANSMDAATLEAIKQYDLAKFWMSCLARKMEMCGFVPVTTLLLYAKERGLKVQVLKYANSGDTAGDKSKVVGYSSIVFYQDKDQKSPLLAMAWATLKSFVMTGKVPEAGPQDQSLLQAKGAFVTLRKKGELRGCIGHVIGDKPLWETVRKMTVAAASQDPRFAPVTAEELKDIEIEISVLSVPQRVKDASVIVLGRDGVIVSDGGMHQGLFLPQVATETGWSKEEFLSELCSQKAGLSADCWKNPKNNLFTFQADLINS